MSHPQVPSHTIPVRTPAGEYDVVVKAGLLRSAGGRLSLLSQARKVAVVTDANVGAIHARPLAESLAASGFDPIVATLTPGETHKTLRDLEVVYDTLLAAKIERSTPIIALGGGIIGDMAGFAAATILRGVPFVQMPTTLLAMVDASVGGKTGVNTSHGKNLIGAFHQPIAVWIDPEVLKSLPDADLGDGLAECIKHDIIRDADHFARLENELTPTNLRDGAFMTELVAHNVAIKAKVVQADPFEHGDRAHLNFGHTFGHAIEKVSGHSYTHGQAVALGITAASFVAVQLSLIDQKTFDRITALLGRAGLPLGGLAADTAEQIIDAMGSDKKVRGGKLRFILPDRIGHVLIRDDVPVEVVRDAVKSLGR